MAFDTAANNFEPVQHLVAAVDSGVNSFLDWLDGIGNSRPAEEGLKRGQEPAATPKNYVEQRVEPPTKSEYAQITPDIAALAKLAVGGGVPVNNDNQFSNADLPQSQMTPAAGLKLVAQRQQENSGLSIVG